MAIIYTYPSKAAALQDMVLISDSADDFKTKNASIGSIKDVIDVVDSLNSLRGDLNIIGGSNIDVNTAGSNITISTSASNVDGSGTTNRIPRWTDSNTLGDSQISQNASSIGIGTALGTSTGSLEVYSGAANNQIFVTTPDTGQAGINFGGISNKTAGRISYSDNSDLMMFHTNNSEKMRILSNGNLGIGTTNPSQVLTVSGKGLFVTGGSTPDSTIATYEKGITLVSGGAGNQRLVIDVSDVTNGGSYIQTRHAFSAFPTVEYALALNPLGGNVGVGITNPSEKLEVEGKVKINGTGDALQLYRDSSTQSNYIKFFDIQEGDEAYLGYTSNNKDFKVSNLSSNGTVTFQSGGGGAGGGTVRLSATGNLGIGTMVA